MSKKHHAKRKDVSSFSALNQQTLERPDTNSSSSVNPSTSVVPEAPSDFKPSIPFLSDLNDQKLYKISVSFFYLVKSIPKRLHIPQLIARCVRFFGKIKLFLRTVKNKSLTLARFMAKSFSLGLSRAKKVAVHLADKAELLGREIIKGFLLAFKKALHFTLTIFSIVGRFCRKALAFIVSGCKKLLVSLRTVKIKKGKPQKTYTPVSPVTPIITEQRKITLADLKKTPAYRAKKRQLIQLGSSMIALVLFLSVAIYGFGTNSTAWFAMNKSVEATGMTVKSEVGENLQISTTPEGVTDQEFYSEDRLAVTYTSASATLAAATSTAKSGTKLTDPSLVYYDPVDINPSTHLPKSDAVTSPAVKDTHYVEYTVYIGVSGHYSLSFTALRVTLGNTEPSEDYLKSVSVDIYLEDNYKGTLSMDDVSTSNVNLGLTQLSPDSPVAVTLRCYFDGAKMDEYNGVPYLKSTTVGTSSIGLKIQFTLDNPS